MSPLPNRPELLPDDARGTMPLPNSTAKDDSRATLPLIAEAETAPIEAAATTEKIGRFEVRAWLGAGAFGDVYRAYDPQLDREVALKVAKPGTLDTPERVQRFLREAKSAANLRHPNIVPVFDSGLDGVRHYIASGFIDGRTLEAVIEEAKDKVQPLAIDEAVRIVRKLATALGYANSRGVVHRDVKPANVMMDETGEPLLIDFGLAGQANRSVGAGSVGDGSEPERIGAGTPAYMAPEQATGSEGPAADQYSLGCTLYELVTGQTPFAGGAGQQVFLHANQPIPSPRAVRAEISRDLEAVILKCVAKEPAQRYVSCEALSEDLRRYLDREPVTARRIGPAERLTKWAKRNPLVAGSLTAAVLALVIGTGVSLWQRDEARVAAKNEAEQRRIADEKAVAATNAEAATAAQLVLTEKARKESIANEIKATANEERANQRVRQMLESASKMTFDMVNKLEDRPGTRDLRTALLENARDTLSSVLDDARKQGNPDSIMVRGYFRMGEIEVQLGNTSAAEKTYKFGYELAQKLVQHNHYNIDSQRGLGIGSQKLGDIANQSGKTKEAIVFYQTAKDIFDRIVLLKKPSDQDKHNLNICHQMLGEICEKSGETKMASFYYGQGQVICEKLLVENPNDKQSQQDASTCYANLSRLMMQSLNDSSKAAEYSLKSLNIRKLIFDADPQSVLAKRDLWTSSNMLGDVTKP